MAYQKKFTKPYPGGYRDFPDESTIITASVMDNYDKTLEDFDTEFETVDGKLEKLKSAFKFDASGNPTGVEVTGDVVANGVSLVETKEAVSANEANITEINSSLTNVENRVTNVEKKATDNAGEIARVDGRVNELKSDLENYANDLICYFEWLNGSFDGSYSSVGGPYTNDDTRYMIMCDFVQATDDIYVYCKDLTKYTYYCYNLKDSGRTKYANHETIYAEDLISTSNKNFIIIPKGSYFRIECRFSDNHIPNENEKYELKYSIFLANKLGKALVMADRNMKKIFTVGIDNCDFEKLSDALEYAVNIGNCELHLAPHVFNIVEELGEIGSYGKGLSIGNNVHIIGQNGTIIRCNYTGGDGLVQREFSIFNALPSDFTIENVRIEAFNVRYCVHDECSGTTIPYTHKYINCDMYHDSHEALWRTSQCIGGGFGTNGTCIVDGGVYETVAQYESKTYDMGGPYTEELRADVISWHSNNSNESAKNTLIIKNVFGDGSLSRIKYSAGSDGLVIINGNSFGLSPSPYSVTPRSYIWNNEIRSN